MMTTLLAIISNLWLTEENIIWPIQYMPTEWDWNKEDLLTNEDEIHIGILQCQKSWCFAPDQNCHGANCGSIF